MNNEIPLTKLREYRNILDIKIDTVAKATGLSISYLSRVERGFVENITDKKKRENLQRYLKRLQPQAKSKLLSMSI